MNRKSRCTQADIARALRAAKQTGEDMCVEISPDGTIRITTEKPLGQSQCSSNGFAKGREITL
jgi:hypothetical protein